MLSYDEAIERVVEAFKIAHPTDTLPAWFENSAFRDETVTCDGQIHVRYYAQPSTPLSKNQMWVKTEGGIAIQEVDSVSGQKRIVISRDPPKQITLFSALINPVDGNVTVLEDANISSISGDEIEGPKTIHV